MYKTPLICCNYTNVCSHTHHTHACIHARTRMYTHTHTHTHTNTYLTEYQFLSEPPEYQYSYPDRVTLFPCEAVMTDDNDNQQAIGTTLYRNQRFMDMYFPPPRHRAWANHEGMVIGIEVNPTKLEDSGSTYQCVIMRNNRTLLRSRRTRLFVGGKLCAYEARTEKNQSKSAIPSISIVDF